MSLFERPILIYDEKCSSCTTFANSVNVLSRGLICCMGHYSQEGREFKSKIFPPDYDSTSMFWLIDNEGAHGGHFGLIPVIVQILRGLFRSSGERSFEVGPRLCFVGNNCGGNKNTLKRIWNLIRCGRNLNFDIFYMNS